MVLSSILAAGKFSYVFLRQESFPEPGVLQSIIRLLLLLCSKLVVQVFCLLLSVFVFGCLCQSSATLVACLVSITKILKKPGTAQFFTDEFV